ncbi:MAG: helix-hairpin-helix domain-containing protein [Elusimicrobiota bacterium]
MKVIVFLSVCIFWIIPCLYSYTTAESTVPAVPSDEPREQLDINKAMLQQIKTHLNLSEKDTQSIIDYRMTHGDFKTVYDIRKVPGIDAEEFARIKPLVKVEYAWPQDPKRKRELDEQLRTLAAVQWYSEAVQDKLEDHIAYPADINKMNFEELTAFPNVSAVDAVAILKDRANRGVYTRVSEIRSAPNLAFWGYYNLRNFVVAEKEKRQLDKEETRRDFYGTYRHRYEDWVYGSMQTYNRITPRVSHKLRTGWKDRVRFGFYTEQGLGERNLTDNLKGYLGFENTDITQNVKLNKLYLGNYTIAIGQGLVLNSKDEWRPRDTFGRTVGLYGDISFSEQTNLRGVAAESTVGNFGIKGFYSDDKKDAILNPDGTVNYYAGNTFSYEPWPKYVILSDKVDNSSFTFNLGEQTVGGHINYSPTIGTHFGMTAFESVTDREFKIRPETLIDKGVLNAFYYGDYKQVFNDEYFKLYQGRRRLVVGSNFLTVINNFSLSGEFARLRGTDDMSLLEYAGRDAFNLEGWVQYSSLNLRTVYRRYDTGFDNPFARPFCEDKKFYDHILKYDYKYADYRDWWLGNEKTNPQNDYDPQGSSPFYNIWNNNLPQGEEGVFFETRWQLSNQFTITRAFVDIWKHLASGTFNQYIQGELEYRPFYEMRITLKGKVKSKNIMYDRYQIDETQLRIRSRLTDKSELDVRYFNYQLRFGVTPLYERLKAEVLQGDYVQIRYTHNFTDHFQIQNAIACWTTKNGGSMWDFEDRVPMDFLANNGVKLYVILNNRISKNLAVNFKFRNKYSLINTETTTTGGWNWNTNTPSGVVYLPSFVESVVSTYRLQLDYYW